MPEVSGRDSEAFDSYLHRGIDGNYKAGALAKAGDALVITEYIEDMNIADCKRLLARELHVKIKIRPIRNVSGTIKTNP